MFGPFFEGLDQAETLGRKFVSAAKFVEKERRHMAGRKDATTASNRVTSHLKFYPFTLFGKNFINLKKYET